MATLMELPAQDKPYKIHRFQVNDAEWTKVPAPWDCDYFSIRNECSAPLRYRTEMDDELSEDILQPGVQTGVTVSARRASLTGTNKYVRFFKDMVIVYVRASSGSGEVVAQFVR